MPHQTTLPGFSSATDELDSSHNIVAFYEKQVWKYDVRSKEVTPLAHTKFDHEGGSAVVRHNIIYVISGFDDAVESLDLADPVHGWTNLASVRSSRSRAASVVCRNHIYTVGGLDDREYSSGERYNIEDDCWSSIAPMHNGRCSHAMVAVEGVIYAIGGYYNDDSIDDGLDTMESFRQGDIHWKHLPSLHVRRRKLAAVVLNGAIYAIGGRNSAGELKSVERFDLESQRWDKVADLHMTRSGHGACVLNGKIYVAGGGNDGVEVYDPNTDVWETEDNVQKLEDAEFIIAI